MIPIIADAVAWVGEKTLVALLRAVLEGDRDKAARLATAAAAKAAIRRSKPR
jgi:hypothetical protein